MIFAPGEVSRSLGAAVGLFAGNRAAIEALDTSIDGFWRSFRVYILVLPAVLILLAAERQDRLMQPGVTLETFPQGWFIIVGLIRSLVDWVAFPVILALIGPIIGISQRYVPLVVALNWCSPIAVIPQAIPAMLYTMGFIGADLSALMALVAFGIALRFQYSAIEAATEGGPFFTAGLVTLSFLTSMSLYLASASLLGV